MLRKHRLPILGSQIILILFSLPTFLLYFVLLPSCSPLANYLVINGFVFLAIAFLLETVAYQNILERQIVNGQNNEPTPEAKKLHEALKRRGIHNELEPFDGYKHVDISIPWAKLNLEVDGKYHYDEINQWFRDLKRDLYSHNDGKSTIHIPNYYAENHLDELADVIAEIISKRNRTIFHYVSKQMRKWFS